MKRYIVFVTVLCLLLCGCGAGAQQTDSTEKTDNRIWAESPGEDSVMNVLFISNSTCYYFTDELMGLLQAAGYEDVTLALVYYSGCSIQRHHQWYLEGAKNYQFRVLTKDGLQITEGYGLEEALCFRNWDVISFDNNARSFASGDTQTALEQAEPYLGDLYSRIRDKLPDTRYFWHQVWANEIGYSLAFEMKTVEQRTQVYQAKKGVMDIMANTYGMERVPTGDAWEKVRDMEIFTTPLPEFPDVERFSLCSRLAKNAFKDDYSHDGDIGGGQYLNACVWFEVLTGESCLGNAFRPQYLYGSVDVSLTEEKISILQNAAHAAVTELK